MSSVFDPTIRLEWGQVRNLHNLSLKEVVIAIATDYGVDVASRCCKYITGLSFNNAFPEGIKCEYPPNSQTYDDPEIHLFQDIITNIHCEDAWRADCSFETQIVGCGTIWSKFDIARNLHMGSQSTIIYNRRVMTPYKRPHIDPNNPMLASKFADEDLPNGIIDLFNEYNYSYPPSDVFSLHGPNKKVWHELINRFWTMDINEFDAKRRELAHYSLLINGNNFVSERTARLIGSVPANAMCCIPKTYVKMPEQHAWGICPVNHFTAGLPRRSIISNSIGEPRRSSLISKFIGKV